MKKIFEKIRKFWKREKRDIKKNYVVSVGAHDFNSKTIKSILNDYRFETVYIMYAVRNNESVPGYMIGFRTLEDAEKYLKNVGKHFYSMGYKHVGIKTCNITNYIEGIHDIGVEGETGVEGKMNPEFESDSYMRRELNEYGEKMIEEIRKTHNFEQQIKDVENHIRNFNH